MHGMPEYFWNRPNREEFVVLMQSKNVTILNKFPSFLNVILKIYSEAKVNYLKKK